MALARSWAERQRSHPLSHMLLRHACTHAKYYTASEKLGLGSQALDLGESRSRRYRAMRGTLLCYSLASAAPNMFHSGPFRVWSKAKCLI